MKDKNLNRWFCVEVIVEIKNTLTCHVSQEPKVIEIFKSSSLILDSGISKAK